MEALREMFAQLVPFMLFRGRDFGRCLFVWWRGEKREAFPPTPR